MAMPTKRKWPGPWRFPARRSGAVAMMPPSDARMTAARRWGVSGFLMG